MKTLLTTLLFLVGSLTIFAVHKPKEATRLAYLARSSDSVTITYSKQQNLMQVTFSDPEWLSRLAVILANSSYEPREHCLCSAYPKIEFYQGGEYVGQLSVHHGEKIRTFGNYLEGDYFVGAATGQAINDLAMEKNKNE